MLVIGYMIYMILNANKVSGASFTWTIHGSQPYQASLGCSGKDVFICSSTMLSFTYGSSCTTHLEESMFVYQRRFNMFLARHWLWNLKHMTMKVYMVLWNTIESYKMNIQVDAKCITSYTTLVALCNVLLPRMCGTYRTMVSFKRRFHHSNRFDSRKRNIHSLIRFFIHPFIHLTSVTVLSLAGIHILIHSLLKYQHVFGQLEGPRGPGGIQTRGEQATLHIHSDLDLWGHVGLIFSSTLYFIFCCSLTCCREPNSNVLCLVISSHCFCFLSNWYLLNLIIFSK